VEGEEGSRVCGTERKAETKYMEEEVEGAEETRGDRKEENGVI